MTIEILPVYAGLFGLRFLALSANCAGERYRTRIAIGDGGDERLRRRIRVHANFAEYVPLTLLILALVELNGAPAWLLHALCLALLAGRLLHAYAVGQQNEPLPLRTAGMAATFGVLGTGSLLALATVF